MEKTKTKRKWGLLFLAIPFVLLMIIVILWLMPKKQYEAQDFAISILKSRTDKDQDGIDDYTDILLGAKAEAQRKPTYHSAYYAGGYPPETEGVCTDVIWRAFQDAGYNLKEMVDADIQESIHSYPRVGGKPDPNIDFRRVPNLMAYFERNAQVLTTDLSKIEEWQPGDIVTFEKVHIGIISDIRNKKGIPYLIHNAGQPNREEDILEAWNIWHPISGHYRMPEE